MMAEAIEKFIPYSIEAEKALLGSLLLDKEVILRIADILRPEDFYRGIHQEIYKVFMELFEKGENIDLLSVSERLKEKGLLEEIGGVSYLSELLNSVVTPVNALNYAKIVKKKSALRELLSASYDLQKLVLQESEDLEILLDKAEKRVFSIAQKSLTHKFVPVKDVLKETWERIETLTRMGPRVRGIPTHFQSLDSILAGLQKSDLIILAARPSLGKSALAINLAANVAIFEKIPVGIFSLEMSKDQIVDRLIACIGEVDLWRLRTGKLSSEGEPNDFDKINQAMSILSEVPIYIDDSPSPNILQIKAMCRRLQAEKGLGLVVIDYIQLMQPLNPDASPVEQVSEISRSLKALAREFDIPVLAISQLSRAVERRTPPRPRLSDLRQSGCLAGDTFIMRADTGERIKIKDLVGKKGIPVYTLDDDWKLKVRKISKAFYSGRKKVYLLKTRSGFEIKASANHPFRKLEGWCSLEKLKIGDKIAVAKKIIPLSPKNELSNEEIALLAHLLDDGCVFEKQPIHYTNSNLKNIQTVAELAKKLFKIEPQIIRQKNWYHVYLPSPYHLGPGKHHPIINWFEKLGLKPVRSWEKVIPEAVFSLDNKKLALFLSHFWATDGNVSEKRMKKRKTSANIFYSTTSPKMAQDVKELLLRFGIRSKIFIKKKGSYRPCYEVRIQGKEHQVKFLKEIGVFGKEKMIVQLIKNLEKIESNTNLDVVPKEVWNLIDKIRMEKGLSWKKLCKILGIKFGGKNSLCSRNVGFERLKVIANHLSSPELSNLAESDVFWDEIVSIKPLAVEDVYDLTVPGTHNFLANNIVVHNSIEQDADVVMFIYREDKYFDTSQKGVAEVIVAKHRNGPVGQVKLYFDERTVSFKDFYEEIPSESF